VTSDAGLVPALTDLAHRFAVESDQRTAIHAEAEQVAKNVDAADAASAKYYVLTFKRVLEKGDAYVSSEISRLQRMADSGNLAPAKKLQFLINVNILQQFQPSA
jgi:hypothetical protein